MQYNGVLMRINGGSKKKVEWNLQNIQGANNIAVEFPARYENSKEAGVGFRLWDVSLGLLCLIESTNVFY